MAEAKFNHLLNHRWPPVRLMPTTKVIDDESDIEALMPKLRHSDYYTKPTIKKLAAKERARPGYCRRGVRNFVVGRHGVGSVKLLGIIDARRLDLESFITFDDVGQFSCRFEKSTLLGFNSMAEITLLVKPEEIDVLITKKLEKGIKFVSYDPVIGEAKFWVMYASTYGKIRFRKPRILEQFIFDK
ncbi:hypothetical protein OSB04_029676 [Centaurea solstitialis]|uniref:Peptidase S59 domain-containing protein n=1 Tax=Centaurea solstitialis TaxID=347529 RepID=A0AA38SDQ1_9ASTR|nr:hypothetical protein OSB04_029676 [Centaurea solstitialis]